MRLKLWQVIGPLQCAAAAPILPTVQMQPDPGFQARLAAQSLRFVRRHPQVQHLEVVVITPHRRLTLGSGRPPRLLRVFLQEVHWISLEELSRQPDLDPQLKQYRSGSPRAARRACRQAGGKDCRKAK